MFEIFSRRRQGRKACFRCTETGIFFEEFKGGFSWPGGEPGFVCILGQKADSGILQVVQEIYEDNFTDLARRCGTLQKIYSLPDKTKRLDWIAPTEGEYRDFAIMLADISKSENQTLWPYNPTISWDLALAVQIVRQELRQNTLLILKNGISQNQIKCLDREVNLKKPDLLDKYAAIMVLAAVIAQFGLLKERIEKFEKLNRWGHHGSGGIGGPRGPAGWMVM